jgi:hypothetical protein
VVRVAELVCSPRQLRDIVCTPIGLKGTVIGVKYDPPGPENKDSAQIWVEYPDGKRCPLEPKLHSGFIGQAAGYRRVSEADHIWRDVEIVQAKIQVRPPMETLFNSTPSPTLPDLRLPHRALR